MGLMSQKVIEDGALSMDTPTDFTLSGGLPEEKSTWEDVVSRGKGRVDDVVQYGTNLVEKGADMALSAGKDIAEDVIEYGADALGFGPEKQISITQEAVLLTNEMVDAGLIPQRYRMQMLLPEVGVTVTRENISIDGGDDSVFNAVNHALFSYEAGQSKVTAVASQAKEVYQGVSKKLSGLDPKTEYLDYFNNKFGFNLAEQGLSREEAKNAIMDSIGNIDQKGASGKLSRGEPLVGGEVLAINQDNIEYGFAAGGLVANEELNVDTLSGYSLSGGLPKVNTPEEGDRAALDAAVIEMRRKEAAGEEYSSYTPPVEAPVPTPSVAIAQTEAALTEADIDPAAHVYRDDRGTESTRGIRNNNPLNIEKGDDWDNLSVDQSADTRFAVFDDAEHGIRAAARILSTYQNDHGLNTVSGMINRWAPPAENDTPAYIRNVAAGVGVTAEESIVIGNNVATKNMIKAMMKQENGADTVSHYTDATYDKALELAFPPDNPQAYVDKTDWDNMIN